MLKQGSYDHHFEEAYDELIEESYDDVPWTLQDIEEYERKYIGSNLERSDIKKAYMKFKGCLTQMATEILFMDHKRTSKLRIQNIINEMIIAGEIPEYTACSRKPYILELNRQRLKQKFKHKVVAGPQTNSLEANSKKPMICKKLKQKCVHKVVGQPQTDSLEKSCKKPSQERLKIQISKNSQRPKVLAMKYKSKKRKKTSKPKRLRRTKVITRTPENQSMLKATFSFIGEVVKGIFI